MSAERLRALRAAKGLSIGQITLRTGLGNARVRALEGRIKSQVRISDTERLQLAAVYGCELSELDHAGVQLSNGKERPVIAVRPEPVAVEVVSEPKTKTAGTAATRKRKEKRMFEEKVSLTRTDLEALQLPANPFPDRPRNGAWFCWPALSELLTAADDTAQDSGLMAIIGPSGAGKSTLLAQLRDNLERSGDLLIVELAAADRGRLDDRSVETAILEALKVPPAKLRQMNSQDRYKRLAQLLGQRARAGARTVLVCDDFHDASDGVLRALRRLREADPRYYLFGAIIAGQAPLQGALESDELREVAGRTQIVEMPVLGGVIEENRRKVVAPNFGKTFLSWHFEQIGITDFNRYFTDEGAAAIAEMAQYPLWTRNLAVRALKKVAPTRRPVDPVVLSKLSR